LRGFVPRALDSTGVMTYFDGALPDRALRAVGKREAPKENP
jgi:hypothetical protein